MALPQDETTTEQPSIDYEALGLEPVTFGSAVSQPVTPQSEIDYEGLGLEPVQYGISKPKKEPEGPSDWNTLRGLEVSMRQVPQLAYGVAGLVGATSEQITGYGEALRDWGFRGYKDWESSIEPISKETDDVTVAWQRAKEGDVGALVDWAQYGIGYALGQLGETAAIATLGALTGGAAGLAGGPTAVPAAAGGAVVAAAGKTGFKALAKNLVEKAIANQAKNIVTQQAKKEGIELTAEQIAKRASQDAIKRQAGKEIGSDVAVFSNAIGMQLGSIYGEAESKAQAEGRELTGNDLARVWATGLATGGVEGIVDKFGLDLLKGKLSTALPEGRLAGAAVAGGVGLVGEAGTEAIQTVGERFGAGKDILSDEAINEYINAAALGGLAGGGIGGVGGFVSGNPKENAAAKAKVAAEATKTIAPETANEVAKQADAVINEVAQETPDERVARLQREAQAAREITLEEQPPVAGLPPVEPTPPVTPTPEAAAAPVEPVVPEGGARPATPEIEAIEGESELRKFVRENAETIEDFELVDITRGEGDAAAKELASSLISERAKQRLKTRIDEGKTALLTQTPEGDIFANSSNDESFNVKLDLLPEERRALSAANADREFAETTEEVANANAAIQEAVRPAVERAVSVPVEGARPPVTPEVVPKAENAVVEAEQKSEQESDTVKVFRGVAEAGALPTGGAFFTDSERDASAYAQLAALRKATEENEDLNDIVSEVMAEEGANDITDLSINTIKSIIEGNNIQVGDISEGAVLRGNIRLGNVLNLESFGSEVGSLPETWNELNELGLVPETWESLDEDVQEELSDKYRGKAFYSLLEGEVNLNDQFAKGIDTIVFTDQNTEGKGTHRTYLTKAAEQFAQEAAPAAVEPTPVTPPVTPEVAARPKVTPEERIAKLDRLKEVKAEIEKIQFKPVEGAEVGLSGLTTEEAKRYSALMMEAEGIRFDLRKELKVEKIEPEKERKSAIPPDIIKTASDELASDRGVWSAITEAAVGTFKNMDTAVDIVMDGKNPDVSPSQLYNAFNNTREALRQKFGDTIKLYRAVGKQKPKATTNWLSTKEAAMDYGKNVVEKEIPIDDIVALNVGLFGRYEEFIVGKKPAAEVAPTPEVREARREPAITPQRFYSQLQRTVEAKMPNVSSPEQLKAIIDPTRGSGVKPEEVKWSGITEAIDRIASENNGRVPKEEILKYLRDEGAVKFEEVRFQNIVDGEDAGVSVDTTNWKVGKPTETRGGREWTIRGRISEDSDLYEWKILADTKEEAVGIAKSEAEELLKNLLVRSEGGKPTLYDKWQLEEGTNYREVVLTMPSKPLSKNEAGKLHYQTFMRKGGDPSWESLSKEVQDDIISNLPSSAFKDPNSYTSDRHFQDVQNYVAHMRLNDRKDADGKDGLFIEEIQSDRHQEGREKGYDTGDRNRRLFEAAKEFYYKIWIPHQRGELPSHEANKAFDDLSSRTGFTKAEIQDEGAARKDFTSAYIETGVPDAPFRKDWPLQMFKRALEEAVTSGKEWIGWTTGETQADRYDLSKQISKVLLVDTESGNQFLYAYGLDGNEVIRRDVRGENIAGIIGKDAAEKLANAPQKKQPNGAIERSLEGVDLKVGASGMEGFYDNILPKEVSKYVKKWGAAVEKSEIYTKNKMGTGVYVPIWRVNITPEMRQIIQEEGQAVFLRRLRGEPMVGMEPSAVEARLQELGFPTGGIIRVVNQPDADFEGRTIILDGKVTGIELNAAALKDNAAIDRVLNHEFAESANADGALNKLVERLTPKEKKEINDTITRLRYEERARTAEEAARAIETLAEAWKGRGFFTRAVARVEAWASKLGFKLTRRAAEYIAARNLADINSGFRAAYNRFINVRGEAREGRAFVTPEENARFLELAKNPEANREELQKMVDEAAERAGNRTTAYRSNTQTVTVFDTRDRAAWFTDDLTDAQDYAELTDVNPETVSKYFLNTDNFASLDDPKIARQIRDIVPNINDLMAVSDAMAQIRQRLGDRYNGIKVTSFSMGYETTHYNPFNPEQIKSSNPVTYDSQGNVIPLEQRFQPTTPDIRYARREVRESRREPEAIPTFTEGTPEAATLKEMATSMAKVDAASEAKGGKPETYKISEIASVWMDSGLDERALQDAIVEYTNLTPANAKRVARAIARQYDIQQSIATAFLETQTGLSVEALPEGVALPKEVDPDRPKPVMQRLFEVFMGVRVPPVKIEVNEKTALKQQIRLKAAANRAAKAEQKRTAEEVVEIIKAMELLGPVRPKQVQALAKRAARVIWTSEKSVEAFSEYAAKVVENANYDADLRAAKDAQKRAKQLSTQKKVAMSPQRQILEDVGRVPVNKLDDPRMFAEAVNYYLRGFKDVLSPDYVVIPDAEMESYLSGAQSETQRNQRDLDREANKRLAEKYGIDPEQVNEMMESIDIIKQIEAQENREALNNLLTEKAVETQQGLRGYDTDNLSAEQRPIVVAMLKIDPKALDPEERQRFIRITNNIIYNNQTNGSEYFLAVAKGQQSAREAAQDSTMIAKNRAWINLLPRFISERMQRGWALELQSVADTFRNAFGKGAMAKVYDAIGMLDLNLGFTKANNVIDEIQEKIAEFHRNLEKKYKAAARNQDGLLAEGVVGFLIQSVPKKDEVSSINQRRDLIKQDIANRKAATMEPDRVAMANRIEAILNRIDGESVQAILNNMKREFPANHESLVWYKDTLLPQYKDFLKSFDENFNDQANNYENPNYLTIGFTSAGPSLAITPEEQNLFYDQVSLRPKQSAYTIKRVDYTELPTDRTTGKPKEIEFNLRRNVFNGLSDQINKAYTSSGWQRIASFMKTPEAEVVFGGSANKDFFIERLNRLRMSRMRRGSMGRGGAIEKAVDSLSIISRKLGTGIALGGIYQWIKQPPDQLITALGSGGRADLLAKNIAPSTQKAARELLNKFSIGRRGDASAGYKYINQMEGHQNRLERYFSESKWDQAKEQAGKIADVWMVALKSSDFLAASAAWMTYYEGELNKQDIKIDDWAKEAELIESDPKRRQAAAFAEQMTDIYQGSSDPTSMATFAQSGKSGWENLVKAIFVPFNSFAIQQRMRLYSDARDAINGSAGGKGGLAGTIGGLILFHATKRYVIPAISGAGIAVLYGLMGVDMDEPDEEKQKEEANKNWRQFLADITGNLLVGGTPQIVESQFIDAMNRASYLVSLQLENDSILNDEGEIMSYDQYSKERSPFYRYKSFDNAMSLGMLEIGLGQAEQVALQTKMLATPEEMEMYTPEEQRLLYFSALSEWLYLMRLNDADFARLVSKARRDMIKAAEEREKEIKRIRSGR